MLRTSYHYNGRIQCRHCVGKAFAENVGSSLNPRVIIGDEGEDLSAGLPRYIAICDISRYFFWSFAISFGGFHDKTCAEIDGKAR